MHRRRRKWQRTNVISSFPLLSGSYGYKVPSPSIPSKRRVFCHTTTLPYLLGQKHKLNSQVIVIIVFDYSYSNPGHA
jgi:hypothetical protein